MFRHTLSTVPSKFFTQYRCSKALPRSACLNSTMTKCLRVYRALRATWAKARAGERSGPRSIWCVGKRRPDLSSASTVTPNRSRCSPVEEDRALPCRRIRSISAQPKRFGHFLTHEQPSPHGITSFFASLSEKPRDRQRLPLDIVCLRYKHRRHDRRTFIVRRALHAVICSNIRHKLGTCAGHRHPGEGTAPREVRGSVSKVACAACFSSVVWPQGLSAAAAGRSLYRRSSRCIRQGPSRGRYRVMS